MTGPSPAAVVRHQARVLGQVLTFRSIHVARPERVCLGQRRAQLGGRAGCVDSAERGSLDTHAGDPIRRGCWCLKLLLATACEVRLRALGRFWAVATGSLRPDPRACVGGAFLVDRRLSGLRTRQRNL